MDNAGNYICDFYLIRHGETDYNKRQLTQGNIEVPLNEIGRQQAAEAKTALDKMGLKFDYCFSSPLGRAKETASVVSGITENDPRFIVLPDLHEMAFGEYERTPYLEQPMMLTFNKHPELYQPSEGGEANEEFFDRMDRVLKEMAGIAAELSEKQMLSEQSASAGEKSIKKPLSILVASHGMVMRGILGVLRHTGPEEVWHVIIGNCDVIHLRLTDGQYEELPKTLSHDDPYDPHVDADEK